MSGPTATTPKLWLSADSGVYNDAGVTLCTNGQTCQQWNDQSGNGNHVTQATSGNRPTYNVNKLNGLPGLTLDGVNDCWDQPYTGEIQTVFGVVKTSAAGNYMTLLGADTSDAVAVGAYYFQQNNSNLLAFARCTTADSGGAGDFQALEGNAISTGTAYIIKGWRSGTTIKSLMGPEYQGPSVSGHWASDTSASSLRPISGTPKLGAGYYSDAIADFWNGLIYEVIVYNSALSDSETAAVEFYLWKKWGFGAAPASYLMSSFSGADGAGAESLRLLESSDGLNFYTRPTYYVPTTGHVVRDPSVTYTASNYWVAHTNLTGFAGNSTGFDVASSADGFAWSYVTTVDCSSISGINRCWAPEWFLDVDGTPHVFFSASADSGGNFTFYETHPTNAAMTTWSTPVAVGGLPTTGEVIDSYVSYVAGTYFVYFKQNLGAGNNFITVYKSTSLLTGYTSHRTGNWAGWGTNVLEGPSVFLLNTGTWIFYGDRYIAGTGIAYSTQTAGDWTGGGSTTWSALVDITVHNDTYITRHGTVVYIPPPVGKLYQFPQAVKRAAYY